ncbi:hypothetical protein [Nocardia nepalensis]|uniref:hypothetical protein n=1 Tax=Nocardia nepalensis TaxID=3375448 RepID=UPI003B66DFC2
MVAVERGGIDVWISEFTATTPTADVIAVARATTRRRTVRRRVTSWEVPPTHTEHIVEVGAAEGALVHEIVGGATRTRLVRAFWEAARLHHDDAAYQTELALWSGRHVAPDGVPARNAVAAADPLTREFRSPELTEAVIHDLDERGRAAAGAHRIRRSAVAVAGGRGHQRGAVGRRSPSCGLSRVFG